MLVNKLWLLALFAMMILNSCDSSLDSEEKLPAAIFHGIERINLSEDGMLVLEWSEVIEKAGEISFEVYMGELEEVPEDGISAGLAGARKLAIFEWEGDSLPHVSGTLIGRQFDSETSFLLTQELENSKAYALQVKAVNSDEIADANNKVIVIYPAEVVEYRGCLSYESTRDSITLDYEFPEKASKVFVFRDGQVVFSTASAESTQFTDKSLKPGSTYQYACEAQVGENRWIGEQIINAQTTNPIADYEGCVSGRATGANSIEVTFSVPDDADEVIVTRDGNEIYRLKANSVKDLLTGEGEEEQQNQKTIVDRDLQEGAAYNYACIGVVGDVEVVGKQELEIRTLSSNPPTFDGIANLTPHSPNEVKVEWGVTSGVQAAVFQIFVSPGLGVDYEQEPVQLVEAGVLEAIVGGLGDELQYSVGVRACSVDEVCDTNEKFLDTTLADGGPPKTLGISEIVKEGNKFFLLAPWEASNGMVAKRNLFRMTGGANPSPVLVSYTDYGESGYEVKVDDPLNPPDRIELLGLEEFTTYHFLLHDSDALASNMNMQAYTLKVGDLTPPKWLRGLSKISNPLDGDAAESGLILEFDGVESEAQNPEDGASFYDIYVLELGNDPNLNTFGADSACDLGEKVADLTVADYPFGQEHKYTLTGLKSRHFYSVCMKARDAAGNVSPTFSHQIGLVHDLTAPEFTGVQGVIVDQQKVRVVWNPSKDADLKRYEIAFWLNDDTSNIVNLPSIIDPVPGLAYIDISPTDFPQIGNGGRLSAYVNACDDFDAYVSGKANCTSLGPETARELPELPDLSPPANFGGIANAVRGDEESLVVVSWSTPPALDDYAGFNIYDTLEGELVPGALASCVCTDSDCKANPLNFCDVELSPARGYNLTVLAVDKANNETSYQGQVSSLVYAPDLTPPVFPSNSSFLAADFSRFYGEITVSFQRARDNQEDQTPGAISYKVYRKEFVGETCDGKTVADIEAVEENFHVTYIPPEDADKFVSFKDQDIQSTSAYVYRIAAIDQNSIAVDESERNITLTGEIGCVVTGDLEPPMFIGGGSDCIASEDAQGCPVLDKVVDDAKEWALSWDMQDSNSGGTEPEDMRIQVYRLLSQDPQPPSLDDNLANLNQTDFVLLHSATGITRFPSDPTERISGPDGENIWVHYLIVLQDIYNGLPANRVWGLVSNYSERLVQIQGITRQQGLATGGQTVAVHGVGFSSQTKIYFKDSTDEAHLCQNAELIKYADLENPMVPIKKIVCETPAWTIASGDVEEVRMVAKMGDYETISDPNIKFAFYNFGGVEAPDHECDDASLATETFSSGSGTEEEPYMICNVAQFKNALVNAAYYVQLANHIDLSDETDWANYEFSGYFNGDDYLIYGFSTDTYRGLIYRFRSPSEFSNLYIAKGQVTGTAHLHTGLLGGQTYGDTLVKLKNVHVNGTVSVSNNHSGIRRALIIGHVSYLDAENVSGYGTVDNHSTGARGQVGGLFGYSNTANIRDAVFHGSVKHSGYHEAKGGIVGHVESITANKLRAHHLESGGTNTRYFGGIVGAVGSAVTMQDVESSGYISASHYSGGIIGQLRAYGTITQATSSLIMAGHSQLGGIIGRLQLRWDGDSGVLTMDKLGFTGKLNAGGSHVGGLVGYLWVENQTDVTLSRQLTINNSYVKAPILATRSHDQIGGFVGSVNAGSADAGADLLFNINNSKFEGSIYGRNHLGGAIGLIQYHVRGPTSLSEVQLNGSLDGIENIGGVLGYQDGGDLRVLNSAVLGSLSVAANAGGFVGYTRNRSYVLTNLQNSFSAMSFPEFGTRFGGLIGRADAENLPVVTSSYFDETINEKNFTASLGNKGGFEDHKLSTQEFSDSSNFFGWSNEIWLWGDGYPSLLSLQDLGGESP